MANIITGQVVRAVINVAELKASIQALNIKLADLEEAATLLEERTKTLADTKAQVIFNTASGDIASFADGADDMPIEHLIANIKAVQSGTGDPSLSNIRPIIGQTSLVLSHGADISDADTISVSWSDSVGEVYSGTLDIITGNMETDLEEFVVDGSKYISTIQELTNTIRFWYTTDSKFHLPGDNRLKIMCDRLQYAAYETDTPSFGIAAAYPAQLIIKLPIGVCEATEASIKAYLEENPIQFVLPLANPVTHQIPAHEVTTLLGNNAIWTDVGPVTVEYPADTGLVVSQQKNAISQNEEAVADTQSMIATVEATTTASKNYSVGDLLVYDGKLYKVTSAIATGATIIVGSNVTQTTVESQIAAGGGGGGDWTSAAVTVSEEVTSVLFDVPLTAKEVYIEYEILRTTTTSSYIWVGSDAGDNNIAVNRLQVPADSVYCIGACNITIGYNFISSYCVNGTKTSVPTGITSANAGQFWASSGAKNYFTNTGKIGVFLTTGIAAGSKISLRYR